MAIGDSGPDLGAQLSLRNYGQGASGSGTPYLVAALLPGGGKDIAIKAMSPQQGFADKTFSAAAQARPGVFAKIFADMGLTGQNLLEGMKKVGDAGSPRQINSITEIQGQAISGGGGFTGNIGPSSGGYDGIG